MVPYLPQKEEGNGHKSEKGERKEIKRREWWNI